MALDGNAVGKKKQKTPLSSTTSGMICSANTVCNSIEIKVVHFGAETQDIGYKNVFETVAF